MSRSGKPHSELLAKIRHKTVKDLTKFIFFGIVLSQNEINKFMEFNIFLKNLREKKAVIFLVIAVVVCVTMIVSLFQPFEYKASEKLLIIQKLTYGTDAYTAAKSAEKIGMNLSEVIYSSSFLDRVLTSEYEKELTNNFSSDAIKREKQWNKMIAVSVVPETSVLEIDTYNTDRSQAINYANAVAYILTNYGSEYHGGGDSVEIKLIDGPNAKDTIARPNFLLNGAIGLIIGIILSLLLVYLFPDLEIRFPRIKRIFSFNKQKQLEFDFEKEAGQEAFEGAVEFEKNEDYDNRITVMPSA